MMRVLARSAPRRAPVDLAGFLSLVIVFLVIICTLAIGKYVALADDISAACRATSAAAKLDLSALAPVCERFTP